MKQLQIPAAWTAAKQAGQLAPGGNKKSEAAKIRSIKNDGGDLVKKTPSRRRFVEHQEPKATPKPQPKQEPTADYLQEVRERINALTVALADTGRMSHAKRARLENQLKQAVANLDMRKTSPKKADES